MRDRSHHVCARKKTTDQTIKERERSVKRRDCRKSEGNPRETESMDEGKGSIEVFVDETKGYKQRAHSSSRCAKS